MSVSSKHVSKEAIAAQIINYSLKIVYSKGILRCVTIFLMLKREPFAYLFKDDDGLTCCLRYRDTNFSPKECINIGLNEN